MNRSVRHRLVARLARRGGYASARVVVTIALLAAGCVAFLSSVLLLHLGLGSMPARYGVVVLVGYLSFLGLLRMAMWLKRKDVADRSLDVCVEPSSGSAPDPLPRFEGGASGGGGGGASWGEAAPATDSVSVDVGAGDDLLPVVLVCGAAAAGVVAVGFVIYSAPMLLGEIALDLAVVSAVSRRARRQRGWWGHGAFRRTWLAACGLLLSMVLVGLLFTWIEPGATSVGQVMQSIGVR